MAEGKVIRYILCKLDDREYAAGDTYEGSPERIEELTRLGYLEKRVRASGEDKGKEPGDLHQDDSDDEETPEAAQEPGDEGEVPQGNDASTQPKRRGKRGAGNGAD